MANPTLYFGKYKTLEELIYDAMLERYGDNLMYIRKFAESTEISASGNEDIWNAPTATHTFQSTAQTLNIVSSSASDTFAGVGARTIRIYGLDSDYNLIQEDVNMNGTSTVTTTQQFFRTYRTRVIFSGTSKHNVGNITITYSGTGNIASYVTATYGVTQMSHFTIPAGYSAISIIISLGIGSTSGVGAKEGQVIVRAQVPTTGGLYNDYKTNTYVLNNQGSTSNVIASRLPGILPEKTDYWFNATSSQNNTKFTLQYDLVLVKDVNFSNNVTII